MFLQFRDPHSTEIKCHYAPVTGLAAFCATRYLQKDDKTGNNRYSFYDNIVVCPHCLLKFPINSPDFIYHTDLCLKDEPTEYKLPPRDAQWGFDTHKKILGSHYSIYCDFECLCKKLNSICDLCLARLEMIVDANKAEKIRVSCNHAKNQNTKCPECFIKISSLTTKIETKCKVEKHPAFTKDQLTMCSPCRKYFDIEVNKIAHTSAHVASCQTCISRHEYCVHTASEQVTSLIPCIVTMVVIDNCYNKLKKEYTITSEDPVRDFFQTIDKLYIELEEEFFDRCQNFPELTNDMMTLDQRYQFKEDTEICYMCGLFTPRGSRTVEHCHITGIIRGMACRRSVKTLLSY